MLCSTVITETKPREAARDFLTLQNLLRINFCVNTPFPDDQVGSLLPLTTHSSSLHPLGCILPWLCSFRCLHNSSFSSRPKTVWGQAAAGPSSCCCPYVSSGDRSAASELDQGHVLSENWPLRKNYVQGLARTQGRVCQYEDGTGWNLGMTFQGNTESNWFKLVIELQSK